MSKTKWTTSRLTEIRHLADETYSSMDTLRLDGESVRLRLDDDLPARIDFDEDDQCWAVTIGEDQSYLAHERGPSLMAAYILAASVASEVIRYTSDALAERAKDLEQKFAPRDTAFLQHILDWQPNAVLKSVKNMEGGIQQVDVKIGDEEIQVLYNPHNQQWSLVTTVPAIIARQRVVTNYYQTLQAASRILAALVWDEHADLKTRLDELENESKVNLSRLKDILDPV